METGARVGVVLGAGEGAVVGRGMVSVSASSTDRGIGPAVNLEAVESLGWQAEVFPELHGVAVLRLPGGLTGGLTKGLIRGLGGGLVGGLPSGLTGGLRGRWHGVMVGSFIGGVIGGMA